MPAPDAGRPEDALQRTLEVQGASPNHSARQTLGRVQVDVEQPVSLQSLRLIEPGEAPDDGGGALELVRTLGEGGMGVVHLARQAVLQRDVAVKRLRQRSPEAVARLLREAQITGRLEHPNIVPVHALGRDREGAPVVVMKRISGTSWLELIERQDVRLERHVEILIHVCNAVHFAHTRGVLHRDIKPENVMVGDFDEIYLMDWGVALDLHERQALTEPGVVGTPAYMAPEMTAGDPQQIDVRSDVYLLGATLHHVLTGKPRHDEPTLLAAIRSALVSEPFSYPPAVPRELGTIANRACHVQPERRYESVLELRDALRSFLSHRSARELASTGWERVAELERRLASAPAAEAEPPGVQRVYDEAAFAFRQALRIHEEDAEAQNGLRVAAERLFDFRLARGDAGGAGSLLDALDPSDTQRHSAWQALQREVADRDRRLAALLHANDPALGRRGRVWLAVGIATVATVSATVSAWIVPSQEDRARPLSVAFVAAALALMGLGAVVFRRRLMVNELSRAMVATLLMGVSAMLVNRLVMVHLVGASARSMLLCDQALVTLTGAFLALRIRILWAAVGPMALAWALAAAVPAWQQALSNATLIGFPSFLAWVWQRTPGSSPDRP